MRFGRMFEGVVVEVINTLPGRTIDDTVGEVQATDYVAIPDEVDVGHTKGVDGGWFAPALQTEGVAHV